MRASIQLPWAAPLLRRRVSVVFSLGLLLGLLGLGIGPRAAVAQTVYPKGDLVSPGPNISTSQTFQVTNDGAFPTRYSLTASGTGAVTSARLVGSSLLRVGAGVTVNVTVNYTTGSSGDGQVLLEASDDGAGTWDQGSVTVSLPSAPPLVTASDPTIWRAENWNNVYSAFHVKNTGTATVTYALTATCSGNIVANSCSVASGNPTVAPGQTTDVTVNYWTGAGAGGNGTVTLTATSPYQEASSASITVVPLSEDVTVTVPPKQPSPPTPDASAEYHFTVSAVGTNTSPITYTLTATCGGTVSCPAQPTPSQVTITPGSPAIATVIASTTDRAGGSGWVALKATYVNELGQVYQGDADIDVVVPDTRSYTVSVTSPAGSTAYTAENVSTNYVFTVTNTGNTTALYNLTVPTCSGTQSGCTFLSSTGPTTTTVTVAPNGGSVSVPVYYTSRVAGQNAMLALRATYGGATGTSPAVTIVPLSESVAVSASTVPAAPAPGTSATYGFTVSATGNNTSPITYTLSASCSGALSCSATPSPATVTITPGSPASTYVTTTATSDKAGGAGSVTLTASYTNSWGQVYSGTTTTAVTVPDMRTYHVQVTSSGAVDYREQRVATSYAFTVADTGNTGATYTLSIPTCAGVASGTSCSFAAGSTVTSTTVSVGAHASTPVYVYFSTGPVGQNASLALRASGPNNTSTGTVTIVPLSDSVVVSATSATPTVRTNDTASYTFTVQNAGTNDNIAYRLQVTGCTAPLTACTVPDSIVLSRGQSGLVPVSFRTQGNTGTGQLTLRAYRQDGNLYQSTATASVTVTSRLAVSLDFMNNDDQNAALCAAACFAMTAARSTVPYYTLDAARSVTLVYNSDRAFPRPFVYADVSVANAPASVQSYMLEVKRNGVRLPFTNGDSILVFNGTADPTRLAGQLRLDPASDTTGVYPVTVVVTAVYANGTTDVVSTVTQLLVVNTNRSSIAKGWTVAGVPRLYSQSDGAALVVDGAGSAIVFRNSGGVFLPPTGNFTTLSARTGGAGWVWASIDSTRVWFNANGFADSVTNRLGFSTRFAYDGLKRLSKIYDPMLVRTVASTRAATILSYGTNGLSSIQEPNPVAGSGRITLVHVSSDSLVKAIVDPDNDSTAYAYDAQKRLASVTDRNGATTTFAYGATWKLSQITSPAVPVDDGTGGTTLQQPVVTLTPWQPVGVPTTSTSSASRAPTVRSDTISAMITDPNGNTSKFTVNRWGQPMTATDPLGNVTRYDRTNTLVTNEYLPDGRGGIAGVSHNFYVGANLWWSQAAGSDTVNYSYGAAGQLLDVSGPGAIAQHYYLQANGLADSVQSAGSATRVTRFTYDPTTMRVESVVSPAGDTTRYVYDPIFGNLKQTTAPGGRSVVRQLDAYGRDSVVTTPAATRVTLYDGVGRATFDSTAGNTGATRVDYFHDHQTVTDAIGQVYRTDFNALGWVTAEHSPEPALAPIVHRYDRGGRATSTTNRRGQTMRATYDVLDRVLTRTDPVSGATTFRYPWLLSTVAAGPKFTDSTTVTLACNGIVTCTADTTVVTYSGTGARYTLGHTTPGSVDATITEGVSNPSYDPDAENQSFATRQYRINPSVGAPADVTLGPLTLRYTYDDYLGLRTGTTLPGTGTLGTRTAAFTTNQEPYLTRYSVRAIDSLYARAYHYDRAGRLDAVQRFAPGTMTASELRQFAYDSVGRLSSDAAWTQPCAVWPSMLGAPAPDSAQGWLYSCGAPPVTGETYEYDAVGNRTHVRHGWTDTPASYVGNHLMSVGAVSFEYDDDGNLTRKLDASTGEDRHFYYDAGGQLDSVHVENGPNPSGTLFLEYDPYSRLSHRTWWSPTGSGAWTSNVRLYLWRGSDLVKEVNESEGTTREYAYDGTDRPILAVTRDGDGNLVATTTYLYDATGSVVGGTQGWGTAEGGPLPARTYSAWGEVTSGPTAPGAGIDASAMRFGFKGMLYDEVLGLYYARARWYDPAAGRFTQEDPIGLAGGINPYTYAGNDPVNASDPSGLKQCYQTGPDTYSNGALTAHVICFDGPASRGGGPIAGPPTLGQTGDTDPSRGGGRLPNADERVMIVVNGVAQRLQPIQSVVDCTGDALGKNWKGLALDAAGWAAVVAFPEAPVATAVVGSALGIIGIGVAVSDNGNRTDRAISGTLAYTGKTAALIEGGFRGSAAAASAISAASHQVGLYALLYSTGSDVAKFAHDFHACRSGN